MQQHLFSFCLLGTFTQLLRTWQAGFLCRASDIFSTLTEQYLCSWCTSSSWPRLHRWQPLWSRGQPFPVQPFSSSTLPAKQIYNNESHFFLMLFLFNLMCSLNNDFIFLIYIFLRFFIFLYFCFLLFLFFAKRHIFGNIHGSWKIICVDCSFDLHFCICGMYIFSRLCFD